MAGLRITESGEPGDEEYLAHVHVRVMERPSYTVREEVGGTAEPPGS